MRVATEARTCLERRSFDGHDVLFADAAAAWAGHIDLIERLDRLAEVIAAAEQAKPMRQKPDGSGSGDSVDTRAEALASRLADDARVNAYELLGDRERAVAIMERRLRLESNVTDGP